MNEKSRILRSRTAKKNLSDNVKKKNFEVTAVEITVNLDFRCSYKSKNSGEKPSLVMKLFEATSWFCEKRSKTDASIAVVNGCIACICCWLLVISDKQAAVIYRRVTRRMASRS